MVNQDSRLFTKEILIRSRLASKKQSLAAKNLRMVKCNRYDFAPSSCKEQLLLIFSNSFKSKWCHISNWSHADGISIWTLFPIKRKIIALDASLEPIVSPISHIFVHYKIRTYSTFFLTFVYIYTYMWILIFSSHFYLRQERKRLRIKFPVYCPFFSPFDNSGWSAATFILWIW